MKRLLITFVISILLVLLTQYLFFENAFTHESMSNSLFIIGLMMFFISLIIVTDAGKIFMIVSYSFKSVMKRDDFRYKSYYDYMKDKEREEMTPYAFQMMIAGITYLIIAYIFAQIVLRGV
ncbi:DUF3899 domain-containing protein [Liberiplasma polymorphum]|uniref:DUF3899 domain-containing protein n=1 Tax=Liberiplasma polymorphum TaxID=3374570 RepID=UPI003775D84B